jgi:hypothetical protein
MRIRYILAGFNERGLNSDNAYLTAMFIKAAYVIKGDDSRLEFGWLLEDCLQWPELYEKHPELKKVRVQKENFPTAYAVAVGGSPDKGGWKILFGERFFQFSIKRMQRTMAHEVTHLVRYLEKQEMGSPPTSEKNFYEYNHPGEVDARQSGNQFVKKDYRDPKNPQNIRELLVKKPDFTPVP